MLIIGAGWGGAIAFGVLNAVPFALGSEPAAAAPRFKRAMACIG